MEGFVKLSETTVREAPDHCQACCAEPPMVLCVRCSLALCEACAVVDHECPSDIEG